MIIIYKYYRVTERFEENICNMLMLEVLNLYIRHLNIEIQIHSTYMIQHKVVDLIDKMKMRVNRGIDLSLGTI